MEEYKTNKGIYANIISKELVSYRFSSGDSYSLNIDIPIGKNNDIRIILDQRLDYHLCISVFSEKPDIINQLKYIDKIKNNHYNKVNARSLLNEYRRSHKRIFW